VQRGAFLIQGQLVDFGDFGEHLEARQNVGCVILVLQQFYYFGGQFGPFRGEVAEYDFVENLENDFVECLVVREVHDAYQDIGSQVGFV